MYLLTTAHNEQQPRRRPCTYKEVLADYSQYVNLCLLCLWKHSKLMGGQWRYR
jgi:hypothetical protein